jgi:hypothetical protein
LATKTTLTLLRLRIRVWWSGPVYHVNIIARLRMHSDVTTHIFCCKSDLVSLLFIYVNIFYQWINYPNRYSVGPHSLGQIWLFVLCFCHFYVQGKNGRIWYSKRSNLWNFSWKCSSSAKTPGNHTGKNFDWDLEYVILEILRSVKRKLEIFPLFCGSVYLTCPTKSQPML